VASIIITGIEISAVGRVVHTFLVAAP